MVHDRRQRIIRILQKSEQPVTGADLAKRLKVSRQVIVQDVAVLRATGERIIATPQGYLLAQRLATEPTPQRAVIACQHNKEQAGDELNILVEHGIKVVDVVVEHPLYGDLRGMLMLKSRADVQKFMRKLKESKAELLSALTGGVHIHTLEIPSREALAQAKAELRRRGYLLEGA